MPMMSMMQHLRQTVRLMLGSLQQTDAQVDILPNTSAYSIHNDTIQQWMQQYSLQVYT